MKELFNLKNCFYMKFFYETSKNIEKYLANALKNLDIFFLHHSCLIRVAIVIGSLQNSRYIEETFSARFVKVLRNIHTEAKKIISFKKNVLMKTLH